MRSVMALFLLGGVLAGDVVVLKDGSRVAGRVADKKTHVEVATDQGLRTWLKEEVEKIVANPAELLGDVDGLLAKGKEDYQRIAGLPAAEQSAAAKSALEPLARARAELAAVRELFPEERWTDLDQKLTQVMQLTRLLRDRVGSSYARAGDLINGPPPMAIGAAVAVVADAKRRADAAEADSARRAFLRLRADRQDLQDYATAVAVVLSRRDDQWGLGAAGAKALEEYFAKPWPKEPAALTPAAHLEAAAWIAERAAALRKDDPAVGLEPLLILGAGHLGHAAPGPDAEKAARGLGLVPVNGLWGTPEGHAVRDMGAWIAANELQLAVLAFIKEHRSADTPAVRYLWSWALLRLAIEKRKGFERAVSGLAGIRSGPVAVLDHAAALAKSIKAAAVCNGCGGAGKLRCTNCFGRKEIRFNCEKCKGAGKVQPPGSEGPGGMGRRRLAEPIDCYPCRGRGFSLLIKCEKCPDGNVDCRQCEAPKDPPSLEDVAKSTPCGTCTGRGTLFRSIAWACPACLGLGQRLVPKAEPAKVLP